MAPQISKSRSKKSKQRDKEERRKYGRQAIPLTSILIGILMWVSVLALLHIGGSYRYSLLAPGQRAPATIVSEVPFECTDMARTERQRQEAAEEIVPVFTVHYDDLQSAMQALERLFAHLQDIRDDEGESYSRREQEESVADVLAVLGIRLSADEFLEMTDEGSEEELLNAIGDGLRNAWNAGIVSPAERESAFHGLASGDEISLLRRNENDNETVNVGTLALPEEALQKIIRHVEDVMPRRERPDEEALAALLRPWITPNLSYNLARTDQLRRQARNSVEEVRTTIRPGVTLVEAGERITPPLHEKLRSHEQRLRQLETPIDRVYKIMGDAGLLLVALIICTGIMQVVSPETLTNRLQLLLLFILSLLALTPAKLLLSISTTRWLSNASLQYLLPFGLTVLLATILLNMRSAIIIGAWTSFSAALMYGHSLHVFLIGMLVTVVTAHAASGVHRRWRLFRAGLWIGLAAILCTLPLAVIDQQAPQVVLLQAGAALVNGFVCAAIALFLIPLFEVMFGITTDITLLELSDMSNPLLQRLAMEAPGTYHHSLMVANLAQAAAQEIGANALLVRVGAYFHDIGKLTKPEFFIENAQFRDNPHDDLAPSMSTLVVTSHVKEGVTLAVRHKLPSVVIDAIQQHHGKGVVSYFYHRAKEQQKQDQTVGQATANGNVKEEDFRYPGPKPQNREMAILALADSIEAASRSMEKPNVSRIENLVSEIVDARIADGQLDDTDLTLSQLAAIKRSFVFTLTNMLHGRIAYPQDENRSKQQTDNPTATAAGDQTAAGVDDEQSRRA